MLIAPPDDAPAKLRRSDMSTMEETCRPLRGYGFGVRVFYKYVAPNGAKIADTYFAPFGCTFRNQSTKRGSPSLTRVVGSYPSNLLALEMSAQVNGMSPGC